MFVFEDGTLSCGDAFPMQKGGLKKNNLFQGNVLNDSQITAVFCPKCKAVCTCHIGVDESSTGNFRFHVLTESLCNYCSHNMADSNPEREDFKCKVWKKSKIDAKTRKR